MKTKLMLYGLLSLFISLKSDNLKDIFTTKYGQYIKISFISKEKYIVTWGSKNVKASNDTFELGGNGVLKFVKATPQAILMQQSCGTSCQMGVVFLFNKKQKNKATRYLSMLTSDLNKNQIAYIDNNSDSLMVVVEDFMKNKQFIIREKSICPAALKKECIEKVRLSNNKLYIKWQGENWQRGLDDKIEKVYFVKGL